MTCLSLTTASLLPILQRTSDGVAIVAPAPWRVLFANRTLAVWLRKAEKDIVGAHLDEVFGDAWRRAGLEEHLERGLSHERTDADLFVELPFNNAEHGKTRIQIVRVLADDTPLIGLVLQSIRDDAETSAWREGRRDPLTDLPDRAYLLSRLETLLRGDRSADRDFVVVFVDLDNFKRVNDRHGHLMGDRVLRDVAARLRNSVREGDHVTRYGGDEFVVLLEQVSQLEEIKPVLDRIRSALSEPIILPDGRLTLSLSIGAVKASPEHRSPEDVLSEADREMYAAKHSA